MNAPPCADGTRVASAANDDLKPGDRKSSDLDDAWFKLPRPTPGTASHRPPPEAAPPPPLDDRLADEWFR
jgi:hypothetical protein